MAGAAPNSSSTKLSSLRRKLSAHRRTPDHQVRRIGPTGMRRGKNYGRERPLWREQPEGGDFLGFRQGCGASISLSKTLRTKMSLC